jgi:1,6-anhydro-N-acetylmuramate kinase
LEAQAMAYLAARKLGGLPGTFPAVTGAAAAVVAGDLHLPDSLDKG